MKLIGVLLGIAAVRESPEEYTPEIVPPFQDHINLIKDEFQFSSYPDIRPGAIPPGIYNFIAGRYTDQQGNVFAISRITMGGEFDIVAAGNTDHASLVLDRLFAIMDERLGFRTKEASNRKLYLSNVVVEFDDGFENTINQIGAIAELISVPNRGPFKIKNLSFSDRGAHAPSNSNDQISTIEMADFVLERRVGHPIGQNRFFSSAPMSTKEHILALEQIESIARGGARGSATDQTSNIEREQLEGRPQIVRPSRRRIKLRPKSE